MPRCHGGIQYFGRIPESYSHSSSLGFRSRRQGYKKKKAKRPGAASIGGLRNGTKERGWKVSKDEGKKGRVQVHA